MFETQHCVIQGAKQEGRAAQEELQCLSDDLALLLREHRTVSAVTVLLTVLTNTYTHMHLVASIVW